MEKFKVYQQQEFAAFTHQQQWRLNAWKQALANSPSGAEATSTALDASTGRGQRS